MLGGTEEALVQLRLSCAPCFRVKAATILIHARAISCHKIYQNMLNVVVKCYSRLISFQLILSNLSLQHS